MSAAQEIGKVGAISPQVDAKFVLLRWAQKIICAREGSEIFFCLGKPEKILQDGRKINLKVLRSTHKYLSSLRSTSKSL